jgi:hypothetical protein
MSTLLHTARRLRGRLTYANVMSTLAVVLVLGTGTAYAAGSIGSRQVIDNSLRSIDIRDDNLKSVDVRNGTLGTADLSDGAVNGLLPRGGSSGGGGNVVDTDDSDGFQPLILEGVQPGNQMVVFAGHVTNSSGSPIDLECAVFVNNTNDVVGDGDDIVGNKIVTTVPADSSQSLAITGVRDVFAISDAVLACVASAQPGLVVSGFLSHVETETLP